ALMQMCMGVTVGAGLTFSALFAFQELKANPDKSAKGVVIEEGLDKSKGPSSTFIVQNGTLKG
ncbi:translation initiation factor IF-2 chloroplastic-like, partial [Trifolium pratense]